MTLEDYLARSGIDPNQLSAEFYDSVQDYRQQIEGVLGQPLPEGRWQYEVPELGEGGSCSLFGQLAPEPYNLELILGGRGPSQTRLIGQATALVQFYRQHSASDWFGVYQKRHNPAGEAVLVKLAYYGAASRPEFPLTEQFATISNNSTVGLRGHGRIINQVSEYLAAGGEYYTCDPKVNAEACLPVFDARGNVVGIVDSETFVEHTFVGKELALLVAIVTSLANILET